MENETPNKNAAGLDDILPAQKPEMTIPETAPVAPAPPPAEPANITKPEPVIKDAKGIRFNPAIHEADSAGRPVYNTGEKRKGTFRKKRGRHAKTKERAPAKPQAKPAEPARPEPEPAGPAEPFPELRQQQTQEPLTPAGQIRPTDEEQTAAELTALSLLPKEIIFRKNVDEIQRAAVNRAWLRYCRQHGIKTPPPWLELSVALSMVYMPEVAGLLNSKEKQAKAVIFGKRAMNVLTWPFRAAFSRRADEPKTKEPRPEDSK